MATKTYKLNVNCLSYGSTYDYLIKDMVRFFTNMNPNMGKQTAVGDEYQVASLLCEMAVKESEYIEIVTEEQVQRVFKVVRMSETKKKKLIKYYLESR